MTIRPTTDRNKWYRNKDGILETTKRYDEVLTESYDFTNLLNSGETVSSATVTGEGATISGVSTATPVVSWTVTGAGYATVQAVTSSSRTLEVRLRWRASDQMPGDYA